MDALVQENTLVSSIVINLNQIKIDLYSSSRMYLGFKLDAKKKNSNSTNEKITNRHGKRSSSPWFERRIVRCGIDINMEKTR